VILKFRGVYIGPFTSLFDIYLKILPQWFDPAEPARFLQINAMCRREWRTHEDWRRGERKRREIVLGVFSTCDELREARSEIKRVPENSRGSARSNYLLKARGVSTDCGIDIFSLSFLYFSIGPAFTVSFSSSRLRARQATGEVERERAKRIILNYFFVPGFGVRYQERWVKQRGQRDMGLAELNTAHKLRREGPCGVRRTAGRNLISLANEFLSKSRVSRLM